MLQLQWNSFTHGSKLHAMDGVLPLLCGCKDHLTLSLTHVQTQQKLKLSYSKQNYLWRTK